MLLTIKIEYTIASFEAAFFYGAFDFFSSAFEWKKYQAKEIEEEKERQECRVERFERQHAAI